MAGVFQVLLVLVFVAALAARAERPAPIELAFAAEQPEMNSEVIAYETQQFRALAMWHAALDRCEVSKARRAALLKQYERAAHLKATGNSTTEAYLLAKYRLAANANDNDRFAIEASQAKASMMVAKMRIMDQGNPNVDFRRQIIEARMDELNNQIKAQRLQLANIEMEEKLTAGRANNGRRLSRQSALSDMELDSRVMASEVSAREASALRNQIQTAELSLKGLELSLKRVESADEVMPPKGFKRLRR